MCGICGIVRADGRAVDRDGAGRDERDAACTAGPTAGARSIDARGRAGRAAAGDHRPRGRRPADRGRGRPRRRRPERRDLQPRRAARRARARRPRLPHAALGHRGARPPLRGARPALRRAPARDVRGRGVGRRAAAARARARPLRHQAALLPRRPGRLRLRLRAEGAAAAARASRATSTSTRSRPSSPSTRSTAPRTIFREVRKLPPGHVLVAARTARSRLERYARPSRPARRRRCATSRGRRWPPSCASGCATPCARTSSPTCRSACCSRAGSTRRRWRRSPRRRAPRRVVDVLDRLRGALVLRGRARAHDRASATAPTTTSSSSSPTPPSCCRRSRPPSTSRSRTPRRCRPTSSPSSPRSTSRSRSRGEGGDELFGGYETYVADLLALHGGRRRARWLSPLAERLPSGSGRVPLDYKLKRFTRAAHLPPLERHHGWKEIFSPDARAELLRPERRGTRTRSTSTARAGPRRRAPSTLARLQDVDRAIYLVDDLLVKTDRMSMAHSLELRVPFLDPAVAELALALPVAARVRGFAKKRLLRSAVEPLSAARSRAGARRASRSPPPRGCAASSSRSAARCWAPSACAPRATSTPRRSRA